MQNQTETVPGAPAARTRTAIETIPFFAPTEGTPLKFGSTEGVTD